MVNFQLWNGRKRQFNKQMNKPGSKRIKFNPADEDLIEIEEQLKKLPKTVIPESDIKILKVERLDITQFDSSSEEESDDEMDNNYQPTKKTEMLSIFPVEYEVGRNKNGFLNINPNKIQMSKNHKFQHDVKTTNNIGLLKMIPSTETKKIISVNKETQTDNNFPNNINRESQVKIEEIIDDSLLYNSMVVKYPQTSTDYFRQEFNILQRELFVTPKIFINITRYVLSIKNIEAETHYKNDYDNIKRKFLIIENELLKISEQLNDDDDVDDESINNNNIDDNELNMKYNHIKNYIFTLISLYFDPNNNNKKNKNYFVTFKNIDNAELNAEQLIALNKPHIIGPNGTKLSGRILGTIDWTKPKQATRKLLMEIFDRNTLASHTLTGKQSPIYIRNNHRPIKNQLDSNKIADIIFRVRLQNSDAKDKDIRSAITTKCADENKMKRYREKKRFQAKYGHIDGNKIIRIEVRKRESRESMESLLRKMLK